MAVWWIHKVLQVLMQKFVKRRCPYIAIVFNKVFNSPLQYNCKFDLKILLSTKSPSFSNNVIITKTKRRPDGRDTKRFAVDMTIWCSFPAYVSENESDINTIQTDPKFYVDEKTFRTIDINTKTIYVKPANWASEGGHRLRVSTYAKNYKAYPPSGDEGGGVFENVEDDQKYAYNEYKIDVVGKIFDLIIYNIDDPFWSKNYQTHKSYFVTGKYDFNGGEAVFNDYMFQLPLMKGKHKEKSHQNVVPRLGYGIEFSIKSIGDYYHANQAIHLEPTYYTIDPKTKERVEVDLYYRAKKGYKKYSTSEDPNLWLNNVLLSKISHPEPQRIFDTVKVLKGKNLTVNSDAKVIDHQKYNNDTRRKIVTCSPQKLMFRPNNRVFILYLLTITIVNKYGSMVDSQSFAGSHAKIC